MAPYTREYSSRAKNGVRAETRDRQEQIRPTSVRSTHWLETRDRECNKRLQGQRREPDLVHEERGALEYLINVDKKARSVRNARTL